MYVLVILLCILAFFTKDIHNSLLRYSTGGVLAVLSILYTLTILKKSLGINLIYEFKKRLNKKNIPANLSFLSFVADIKRTQNHIHQPQIFTLGTGSQISDIRFRPT